VEFVSLVENSVDADAFIGYTLRFIAEQFVRKTVSLKALYLI